MRFLGTSVLGGPALTWGALGGTETHPHQPSSTSAQRPELGSCPLPWAAQPAHQRAAEVGAPAGPRAGSSVPLEPPPSAQEGIGDTPSWAPSAPEPLPAVPSLGPSQEGRRGEQDTGSQHGSLTSERQGWRPARRWGPSSGPGLRPACHFHAPSGPSLLHRLPLGLGSDSGCLGPWCLLAVGETTALMPTWRLGPPRTLTGLMIGAEQDKMIPLGLKALELRDTRRAWLPPPRPLPMPLVW